MANHREKIPSCEGELAACGESPSPVRRGFHVAKFPFFCFFVDVVVLSHFLFGVTAYCNGINESETSIKEMEREKRVQSPARTFLLSPGARFGQFLPKFHDRVLWPVTKCTARIQVQGNGHQTQSSLASSFNQPERIKLKKKKNNRKREQVTRWRDRRPTCQPTTWLEICKIKSQIKSFSGFFFSWNDKESEKKEELSEMSSPVSRIRSANVWRNIRVRLAWFPADLFGNFSLRWSKVAAFISSALGRAWTVRAPHSTMNINPIWRPVAGGLARFNGSSIWINDDNSNDHSICGSKLGLIWHCCRPISIVEFDPLLSAKCRCGRPSVNGLLIGPRVHCRQNLPRTPGTPSYGALNETLQRRLFSKMNHSFNQIIQKLRKTNSNDS